MHQALSQLNIGITLQPFFALTEWLEESIACHVHIHTEAPTSRLFYLYV